MPIIHEIFFFFFLFFFRSSIASGALRIIHGAFSGVHTSTNDCAIEGAELIYTVRGEVGEGEGGGVVKEATADDGFCLSFALRFWPCAAVLYQHARVAAVPSTVIYPSLSGAAHLVSQFPHR